MTTFTAGAQNTLPIWIFGNIRLGQQLPQVNVVVFFVIRHDRDSRSRSPQRLTRDTGILQKEVVVSTTVSKHQNLIGGEWVDAAGGGTMEVLNPATGEVIAEVPARTADDVDRAVEAAKQALPEWLDTTPASAAELLLKLADAIDEHAEELARARVAQRRQAARRRTRGDARLRRQPPLLRRRRARCSRASRPASTCGATRRRPARADRRSSAASRRGTTR